VSNFIPATLVEGAPGSDRGVVEIAGGRRLRGRVTDPAGTPEPGAAVTVAVRPERLRVDRAPGGDPPGDGPASAEPGWTAIAGRVRQGTYLGDQTEFRVETAEAGELIARRQNTSGVGSAGGVGPGDPVVVSWHEEANLILIG
jgi:ABC-type Fe3+/spermidine/putrescine transport system ATPase subunit